MNWNRGRIPLLGKGGVRGGLVNIRAESFWKSTELPVAPPLPRGECAHDSNSFTPVTKTPLLSPILGFRQNERSWTAPTVASLTRRFSCEAKPLPGALRY